VRSDGPSATLDVDSKTGIFALLALNTAGTIASESTGLRTIAETDWAIKFSTPSICREMSNRASTTT
jgi:hypothetical protein